MIGDTMQSISIGRPGRSDTLAVTTYRRANGSQAQTVKPRVGRVPKTFPRAHTPSPVVRIKNRLERLSERVGHVVAERQMRRSINLMWSLTLS